MSDIKTAGNFGVDVDEKRRDQQRESIDKVQEQTEVCADINNVAALGFEDTDQMQKKIVRKLDTWMLPQLWILYMFNYLNRTNIAQARLNTFDEDLSLRDGDYQVFTVHPSSPNPANNP
jgi:hypothetical protein